MDLAVPPQVEKVEVLANTRCGKSFRPLALAEVE